MSSTDITLLPGQRLPQPPQSPPPRPRSVLAVLLVVLAVALLGNGACKALGLAPSATPAASGSAAPAPDELAELERLVSLARPTLALARLTCEVAFVNLAQMECLASVEALDDLVDVAAATLATAQACREGGDAACVTRAAEQAREQLPALRRLLGRAEALAAAAPPELAPAAASSSGAGGAAGAAGAGGAGAGGGP